MVPPIQPIAKAAPASSRIRQGLVRKKCSIMNIQVSNGEDTMVLAATLPLPKVGSLHVVRSNGARFN